MIRAWIWNFRCDLVMLGYKIKPYDMLADRRRWFWQPRTPCQFSASDEQVARWFGIPVELLKRLGR